MIVAPLAILGMGSTAVKFNSTFKNDPVKKRAFTTYLFIGSTIGLILILLLTLFFKEQIVSFYIEKSPLVGKYYEVSIILIGVLTYLAVNESISRANLNAILPGILKDVLVRILGFTLLVLYGFNIISFDYAVTGIIFLYVPSLIILFFYNGNAGFMAFSRNLLSIKENIKSLNSYALYSALGSAGNLIVLNIDIQMISAMLSLDDNGIYTRAFYMAIFIELPRRAISQIAGPVIANAFKYDDFKSIKTLYKKLSVNQMVVGSLLILGILINIDNIYELMPNGEDFKAGAMVVLIVGIAKLSDMTFSVNSEIILMSKHYKFSTYSIVILSILTISLNYTLIPIYGINGAALASLISMIVFNLLKMVFVWWKFKMIPLR